MHVVPALDEGLGLTAVESLLSETPVVGFRSGGLPDIVPDGVAGRLVEPGDEPALADALDALLAEPETRRAMGEAGRAHAMDRFGAAAASERYAELYRRTVVRAARSAQGDARVSLASTHALGHFCRDRGAATIARPGDRSHALPLA